MNRSQRNRVLLRWAVAALLAATCRTVCAEAPIISPSAYWKNGLAYPYDTFCNSRFVDGKSKWIKFTILLEPYDPNVVYFQDSSNKSVPWVVVCGPYPTRDEAEKARQRLLEWDIKGYITQF